MCENSQKEKETKTINLRIFVERSEKEKEKSEIDANFLHEIMMLHAPSTYKPPTLLDKIKQEIEEIKLTIKEEGEAMLLAFFCYTLPVMIAFVVVHWLLFESS